MADNKLQSLTEIFNEKFFRIPDFQRGYSWGKKQLEDFWKDLTNLKERIHYTGLLTVEPVLKSSVEDIEKWKDDLWLFEAGLSAYYVIDGQQRLTTLIILINEILNQFGDNEKVNFKQKSYWVDKFLFQLYEESDYKSYIFGYERDNPSDEFFKTKILQQESSTADKVPEQTLYTSNLIKAKDFFKEKLEKIEKQKLEEIFKKVTTMFKFNFYEIDDELDVYVTFETMNNRGKPLSDLEILKNRLIYLSTILEVKDERKRRLRKDINETWKTVYEYLGKNKDKPMNDDVFLFNHWVMYKKYEKSKTASDFLLNEMFTVENAIDDEKTLLEEIQNYISSLSKCVKSWFYLFNPQLSEYQDETKEWIKKLNRLSMRAFPPLFMSAMTKCSESEFLPLFKSAERFIFLVFQLSQRKSDTGRVNFYKLANEYHLEETTIEGAIGEVNSWVDRYFNLVYFKNYVKDQYDKEDGFYTWSALKYFLFEYELHLQEKAKENQKVTCAEFNENKKETIEHIYPKTPKDDCWTSVFNKHSEQERKILLNSLGNLVLLGRSKNSQLQNKCFGFKKRNLNKNGDEVGFFNGSYSEIEVSGYNNWTPREIESRGKKMLSFLEERWDINFECWEIGKQDLLGLNFLESVTSTPN